MAEASTKYFLQQAYIKEKAHHTGRKGAVRINESDPNWNKIGNFVEQHDISPELYMKVAFQNSPHPNSLFLNILGSDRVQKDVLVAVNESTPGSSILNDFDEIRRLMLHSCVMETGMADMGNPIYKRALWKGMYDGYDPCVRFLTIYPELPVERTMLDHHLVKDALRRALYAIKTDPGVKLICKRLKIDYQELINWEAFDAIK